MNETLKTNNPKGGARSGAGRPKKDGRKTSFFLSNDALDLCVMTAEKIGANQTTVIEMAIREFAAKHGVQKPQRNEEN